MEGMRNYSRFKTLHTFPYYQWSLLTSQGHQYIRSIVVVPIPNDLAPAHRKYHYPIVLIVPPSRPHSTAIPSLDDHPITFGCNLQRLHPLELHLFKELFEKCSTSSRPWRGLSDEISAGLVRVTGYRKSTILCIRVQGSHKVTLPKCRKHLLRYLHIFLSAHHSIIILSDRPMIYFIEHSAAYNLEQNTGIEKLLVDISSSYSILLRLHNYLPILI